jgi:hypothetical protein
MEKGIAPGATTGTVTENVIPVVTRTSLPITTFSEGTCTLKISEELEDEVEGKRW